jgi:hypothetical protein
MQANQTFAVDVTRELRRRCEARSGHSGMIAK